VSCELIFCWQRDFAPLPFTLHYVQYVVTSVLQDQQYMLVWCKKFARGREKVVGVKRLG